MAGGKKKQKKNAKSVMRKFFRNTGRQLNQHAIRPIGRAFKGRAKRELKKLVAQMTDRINSR